MADEKKRWVRFRTSRGHVIFEEPHKKKCRTCENTADKGVFIGDVCAPCYEKSEGAKGDLALQPVLIRDERHVDGENTDNPAKPSPSLTDEEIDAKSTEVILGLTGNDKMLFLERNLVRQTARWAFEKGKQAGKTEG